MRSFKSSDTVDALQDLNLNGDDADSDYHLVGDDDLDGHDGAPAANRQPASKLKYMNLLKDVADRKVDNVLVDLDDLELVSSMRIFRHHCALTDVNLVRESSGWSS